MRRIFIGPFLALFLCFHSTLLLAGSACQALLAFAIPQEFQRRDIPVALLDAGIQQERKQDYYRDLDRIRDAVQESFGERSLQSVRTVIYPMAGTDAGLAPRVFQNAELVIGLDQNPFLKRPRAAAPSGVAMDYALQYRLHNQGHYKVWSQVEEDPNIPASILAALHTAIPGFRPLGVTAFYDASTGASHGLVRYDTGPGTPERFYLHLNVKVNAFVSPELWWMRLLDAAFPQAVVVKASQNSLSPEVASGAVFRQSIEDWLQRSRGYLLEGRSLNGQGWEFSGQEHKPALVVEHVGYGYGTTVRINAWNQK